MNVHEVRFEYEKQNQVYVLHFSLSFSLDLNCHFNLLLLLLFRRAALAEELALLKQVDQLSLEGNTPPKGSNGHSGY